MKEPLIYKGSWSGRNRTRTCDPIDVNDVLYQLSHATIAGAPSGIRTPDTLIKSQVLYRLS